MTTEPETVVTHEQRMAALEAVFELLRAVLQDRSSPPKEPGVRLCISRKLLELLHGAYPPYPTVTPKGAAALVELIDGFERLTKEFES